jgi:hypothetical protein
MQRDKMKALAERVEIADEASIHFVSEVAEALVAAYPGVALQPVPDAAMLRSTDAALHIVHGALPAWQISLRGVALEPHGHWHCSLRETSAADDDAAIGFGEAPVPARALMAALLRLAAVGPAD